MNRKEKEMDERVECTKQAGIYQLSKLLIARRTIGPKFASGGHALYPTQANIIVDSNSLFRSLHQH